MERTRLITAFVLAKALLHLAIAGRYGYHGDELYFLQCAEHLDWGYVDHPPVVPWLAWLASPFDSVVALRLPSILAGAGTMLLTLRLVRLWGGDVWATWFAGLGVLFAPAILRMHSMLDIPAIEVFVWTAASYVVARIAAGADQRLWIAVGAIAGVGLLTKHSVGLWGAGIAVGLAATKMRSHLRTPWPWLGGALAIVIALPNVIWLAQHDWATLEFLENMRRVLSEMIPKPLFVAGQLLYMHPVSVPIWGLGLWALFRREQLPSALGWVYVTPLFVLLVVGGKPYYLAPAYPVLFAAGGLVVATWSKRARVAYSAAFVTTGVGLALCVLPILPIRTIDSTIDVLLGWAVPNQALTHDLHAQFGWEEHARAVRDVYDSLSTDEKARTTLLTGNYSDASALRHFEPELPPATSGHLSYWLWGPGEGDVVIAWALSEEWLRSRFSDCRHVGTIDAPLARTHDQHVPIFACRGDTAPHWDALRNYDNSGAHPSVASETSAFRGPD